MPWPINVSLPDGALLRSTGRANILAPPPVSAASQTDVREGIEIEWRVQRYLPESGRALFSGGVRAKYGPTVLTADELELDYTNKRGWARGKVTLNDPDGRLSAEELEFNWADGTGTAQRVDAFLDPVQFRAQRVTVKPGEWTLYDVYASPSRTRPPEIAVRAPQLTIKLGASGRLKKPSFSLFGWRTGPYPSYSFSLDPRVQGFRVPAVTFKQGAGVGVAWQSGFIVAPNLSVFANTTIVQTQFPSSRIAMAWSALPPNRTTGWILPQSELSERFNRGYLENVYVKAPESEEGWIGAPRRTVAIISSYNESPSGRRVDPDTVTKPWDLAMEASGKPRPRLAAYAQARVQSVRLNIGEPFETRALAQFAVVAGPYPVGRRLDARLRLDSFGTTGAGTNGFGWTRGAASLTWRADSRWILGVQSSVGAQYGEVGLPIDPLAYANAVMARATYDHGPYRASIMFKYDYRQRRWYDTEYAASFVAGSFQPYVEARLFPREYRLGIRLRLDEFFARLKETPRPAPQSLRQGGPVKGPSR